VVEAGEVLELQEVAGVMEAAGEVMAESFE